MKTTPKPTIPKHARAWAAAAALVAPSGTAQAAPVFQGRLADNTASATCTPSGTGGTTECTSFYLSDPDNSSFQGFTILNNWSPGRGSWSGTTPPAPGSAQAIAASAGLAATGLDGWRLPTGDGEQAAGPLNQYRSIWNAVGGSLVGLQNQFDGVQCGFYGSVSEFAPRPGGAWGFVIADFEGFGTFNAKTDVFCAVAVRTGDVVAVVPEPQAIVLALTGLGVLAVMRRRRPH
jgi:hypothetical protein